MEDVHIPPTLGLASVTLTVVAGELTPATLTVHERTTCVVGRGRDCMPKVPDTADYRSVSRNHCLLDINPPDARVRDFGSLNGTYVNGEKIGQRAPGQTQEHAAGLLNPEHDLADGDEIRVGPAVIRVGIQAPAHVRPHEEAGQYEPAAVARTLLAAAQERNPDLAMLSGYSLVGELGRGGMGAVYLLRHETTGERMALKLMLPKVAVSSKARARFVREATHARALHHPNIVTSYDAHFAAGTFSFTSEYCAGGSLEHHLQHHGGRIPVNDAVRLTIQVLGGLAHAHRQGVVHRDVSPHNILLSRDPDGALIAKVSDFGLAKAFDLAGFSGLTSTGATAGKPTYQPRQQVINFREAAPAVDVWAAAACLYRMVTGACPRDFPTDRDPWLAVLQHAAVPVRQRDPRIPAGLAQVLDRALVDDPEIGIQDAEELSRVLRVFATGP
ncbi:protein kinase domain-containing protein [Streptomyces niveus]|uniref:protein kinase domain-containing protein n=1 Tax=Streptomyces niveus TaxID=193462 RepID=UPI003D0778A1